MFAIVKHASNTIWEAYFETDPKLGVDESHSAYFTYSGKFRLQITYTRGEKALAKRHCKEMNKINPAGNYAICRVIQKESNHER